MGNDKSGRAGKDAGGGGRMGFESGCSCFSTIGLTGSLSTTGSVGTDASSVTGRTLVFSALISNMSTSSSSSLGGGGISSLLSAVNGRSALAGVGLRLRLWPGEGERGAGLRGRLGGDLSLSLARLSYSGLSNLGRGGKVEVDAGPVGNRPLNRCLRDGGDGEREYDRLLGRLVSLSLSLGT